MRKEHACRSTTGSKCKFDIDSVKIEDLSYSLRQKWISLQQEHSFFCSPFLGPGYSELASNAGLDIRVGLITNDDQVVGFFPYQLEKPELGCPVGDVFCDYQAVISTPNAIWDLNKLILGLNLKQWRFDHLLFERRVIGLKTIAQDVSWLIDIKNGFSAYESKLKEMKRTQLSGTERKIRMVEREIGPLEFSHHIIDHGLLDILLDWKSEQWEKSGWAGRYKSDWEQKFIHQLIETNTDHFGGLFSVLKVQGEPMAMHVGMRSHSVWHYWLPAYNPTYKRYSPGIILLVKMVRFAQHIGITTIDLGKEDFEYKRRLHTHKIQLLEGIVEVSPGTKGE